MKTKKKECYFGYNNDKYDYGILNSIYNKNYSPKYTDSIYDKNDATIYCNNNKRPIRRYFRDYYNRYDNDSYFNTESNNYYPRPSYDYFFTRYT
jgi:hypothetical protein